MLVIQDFMDPYTLNVKQLMKCCVEEITPDGRLIPFCAYNSVGYREQVREQLSGAAVPTVVPNSTELQPVLITTRFGSRTVAGGDDRHNGGRTPPTPGTGWDDRPEASWATDPDTLKACCAAVYEQDLVALLLGESYHPGGADLTRHLARALDLRPGQRVLDVAAGRGATACLIAAEFGVAVDGIDLGSASVERARAAASERGLDGRVRFHGGDAEHLPFDDGTFDAVICECAWCTFPDKATAATEFARVLRPGGQAGITDVSLDRARLDPELATLAGYVACIADACTAAGYAALLEAAGLRVVVSEAHDGALTRMIDQIDGRLRALAILSPPGLALDPAAILPYTTTAARAVTEGVAGYQLLVARKPEPDRSRTAGERPPEAITAD